MSKDSLICISLKFLDVYVLLGKDPFEIRGSAADQEGGLCSQPDNHGLTGPKGGSCIPHKEKFFNIP